MYLRHLEYLRLVVEHGSFAAAAQAAGVTQPAISHGMKQLQSQFGTALFVRSGRRLLPTELALQVARQGASLAEQVGAWAGTSSRRSDPALLRVGLTPSAALVCGPVLLESWSQGHARRRLQLVSADEGRLLAGLQRREFDLVISPRPRGFQGKGLACEALYQLQPQVYARRLHPLARAQALEQLQDAAWASVGPSVRGPVDVLTEAFEVRRMPPARVVVSCPDYASMLNLMAHEDLLAVIPHPALLAGESIRGLVPLRLRETLPLYEMWLFHPAVSRRAVRSLIPRLLQRLKDGS
ncbi:LysR family transcriptional regulator [Ideonella sp. YS5]|uniref:LysR family transcriptional regulator n=1 Tax=Ideonella sp. YS5 TaxID=3453714 RepID=UPI003EED6DA9